MTYHYILEAQKQLVLITANKRLEGSSALITHNTVILHDSLRHASTNNGAFRLPKAVVCTNTNAWT